MTDTRLEYFRLRAEVDADIRRDQAAQAAAEQRAQTLERERQQQKLDELRKQMRAEARRHSEAAIASRIARGALPKGSPIWTPLQQLLTEGAVDLALAANPRIDVEWVFGSNKSTELVGPNNALSMGKARMIACWPITDAVSASTVWHELGHQHDPDRRRRAKIDGETFAWRWAYEHALVWDRACTEHMRKCLGSYLANAEIGACAQVVRAERFIREAVTWAEKPAAVAIERFEDREFLKKHGFHECERRLHGCTREARKIASIYYVCRSCFTQIEMDRWLRNAKRERASATRLEQCR